MGDPPKIPNPPPPPPPAADNTADARALAKQRQDLQARKRRGRQSLRIDPATSTGTLQTTGGGGLSIPMN